MKRSPKRTYPDSFDFFVVVDVPLALGVQKSARSPAASAAAAVAAAEGGLAVALSAVLGLISHADILTCSGSFQPLLLA